MMHGKGLAFAGVCLRAWRRLCTQQTGWPAEKAALEQALRVAQTSKDTEVRRVEKLQWEARLEAQVRAARAAPHRTAPHARQRTARARAHLHAPARTCTGRNLYATGTHSAPCRALRTLVRPSAPPCALPHPRAGAHRRARACSAPARARGAGRHAARRAARRGAQARARHAQHGARRSHHCAHPPQEHGWQRAGSLHLPRPPRPHAGVHSSHL